MTMNFALCLPSRIIIKNLKPPVNLIKKQNKTKHSNMFRLGWKILTELHGKRKFSFNFFFFLFSFFHVMRSGGSRWQFCVFKLRLTHRQSCPEQVDCSGSRDHHQTTFSIQSVAN